MSDTQTPGQICYEAYCCDCGCWRDLDDFEQQRWEAAAQAVLDAGPVCLLCGTRLVLQRCTRFEDPHWIGCLSCGGIGYVAECPGEHTEAIIAAYAAREREKTHDASGAHLPLFWACKRVWLCIESNLAAVMIPQEDAP